MEIIISHTSLDFDGLASMVAASKLYPGAIKVFSGTMSKNVRNFMSLYKDSVHIKGPREIDSSQVSRVIMVDTANATRIGLFQDLAHRPEVDFHVYDHHPSSEHDVSCSLRQVQKVGATTTILVEMIRERGLSINAFDATILALGIYEDTGSLLFSTTTARDAYAAAFLLDRGANLSVVNNFMEHPFSGEQMRLLQEFMDTAATHRINNIDVVIAVAEAPSFVPGMDVVTHRIFEMKNADVVFAAARMDDRVHVVARSRVSNARVNEVLRPLGGSGHEKAAAAVVKDKKLEEVVDILIRHLQQWIHPPLKARDIMSSPVKTLGPGVSMEEAGRIMLRYGHTGMPVVEDGRMIGVISRRDVDKALLHKLGHAPVKGFMTTNVVYVGVDTSISELQGLMVKKDVGRLPVVDGGAIVGIVSRTDILRTLHGEDYPEDHELLFLKGDEAARNMADVMNERLPGRICEILVKAGRAGDRLGFPTYCVGGFVRDLLLNVPNYDVDLVVEGDGTLFAKELANEWGAKVRVHDRFKTAVIVLDDTYKIDVATARTEYYEYPAALPQVTDSSLREDMYRRDFTINTLAICLNPGRYGELIDYFGGRRDIEQGCIRILYNLSFVEDPTRILRAIRFEQRYGMTIESDTLRFAADAIERRMIGQLSYKRILNELMLILGERDPMPAINRMHQIGVWEYILPEVSLDRISVDMFRRVVGLCAWWKERYAPAEFQIWLVYFMVILSDVADDARKAILQRYPFENYARACLERAATVPRALRTFRETACSSSAIHGCLASYENEMLAYLLLCIQDEESFNKTVDYLDKRARIKVAVNGRDLIELGLKPGPEFSVIKDSLYLARLDGLVSNKTEELDLVARWISEGRFQLLISR